MIKSSRTLRCSSFLDYTTKLLIHPVDHAVVSSSGTVCLAMGYVLTEADLEKIVTLKFIVRLPQ